MVAGWLVCGWWHYDFKIHMEMQRAKNSQDTFKELKEGGLILLDIKSYYKATIFNSVILTYDRSQLSINSRMDISTVKYSYNRILHSNENKLLLYLTK